MNLHVVCEPSCTLLFFWMCSAVLFCYMHCIRKVLQAKGLLVLCVKVIYEGRGLANSVFFMKCGATTFLYCFL
jgi:hypothetical protein